MSAGAPSSSDTQSVSDVAEYSGRGAPIRKYTQFLQRRKLWVLAFWAVVGAAGLCMAPFFILNTVRARSGRLSALRVFLCKSDLYGAFV
jgi:hypothetical protein